MKKKKLAAFVGVGALVVLSSIMWFYFSKPSSFPSNERLVKEINSLSPEADAKVTKETIPIDDRHVAVPFISNKDDYGLSYWVWKKHKWTVANVDTKGEPKVWKINRNNPSSYYFVWNIPPEDQLSSIHFYLIRDRGYQVADGKENYVPRVQMEKEVLLQKKSYGALKMPSEWAEVMNSMMEVESAKQPDLFFHNVFPARDMFMGWIPYGQSGKETYPEHSVNGSGYSDGDLDIDHMMILDSGDLEKPVRAFGY